MARDKYVFELDDYFNQPKFMEAANDRERWALLSKSELDAIIKEIDRCRNDFEHAAKNWFWISDKSGRRVLFDLWDGQLLVIEKLRDMKRRGKPQYVVVIKSRQLGLSQLGCALGAHKCFFTSNQNGLIISEDDEKTANLWGNYILPIYQDLPWFMKPNATSLTIKDGIKLDNDPKRSNQPGLRSNIKTVSASSTGYVGQGTRLNFFHGSEFTSWPTFNDIIERGIQNALFSDVETIGILESTAKGAGTATHSFWNRMSRAGDDAKWEPVFLPFFMDKRHVLAPSKGWRLGDKEKKRREAVEANWVRCDNKHCLKYFNRIWSMKDMANTACRFCEAGTFHPYVITDEQLYWMSAEELSSSREEYIKQEQAITAEEAFLIMGDKVFSQAAIDYASFCAEKSKLTIPWKGFFDANGRFHGFIDGSEGACSLSGCKATHSRDDNFLTVWEQPQAGAEYFIGADIAEGIGKDYSVFVVIKKGNGTPDLHVATYRDRVTTPYTLAYKLKPLGDWYNRAQIAIEYAGGGASTADTLLNTLGYGNCYQRKNSGDFSRSVANGYHWQTTGATKPKIIAFFERWLKDELLILRDPDLVEEIKVYVRVEGTQKTEAKRDKGSEYHDDYLVATMIALYTAHQNDFDQDGGITPFKIDPTPENQLYKVTCCQCYRAVGVENPMVYRRCHSCGSMQLIATRNLNIQAPVRENPYRDIITGNYDSYEGATYGTDYEQKPYLSYW